MASWLLLFLSNTCHILLLWDTGVIFGGFMSSSFSIELIANTFARITLKFVSVLHSQEYFRDHDFLFTNLCEVCYVFLK